MKRTKRILAIAGVVLLAGIYLAALISALFRTPFAGGLFKASLFCTVAVPVLLYAYMLIYRILKRHGERKKQEQNGEKSEKQG